MPPVLDANFIRAIGLGRLVNFEGTLQGAVIDSRKIRPGLAFFALRGENEDGHLYVDKALVAGGSLAVVASNWSGTAEHNWPLWIVPDPEQALQALAERWRAQFNIPFLAITGTNGKTTTRAMCAAVVGTQYNLHSTSGNLNNQLGLPLTLLDLTSGHQFSLLEMGTNHFGEIASLCQIAHPTAGLITNIGHGHLEFFGSIDGVRRAKAELFERLPSDGIAFVNTDDENIKRIPTSQKRFTFGFNSHSNDVNARLISFDENACPQIEVNGQFEIKLKVSGYPAAQNALAAVAVGLYYQIAPENIKAALENFTAINQRFIVQTDGPCRIINDAYNANPDSTLAALRTFQLMKLNGRRIFIMGDMRELGDFSLAGHVMVGEAVAAMGIDAFYGVGELTKKAIESAYASGLREARHFPDKTALVAHLHRTLDPEDTVLVKGSRGSRMEEVITKLKG